MAVDGQSLHPLDAASRLVQEDLVVMVERGDRLVFGAGSVCFPNRWDLRSKLGLSLRDVHAPVSLLNDQLGDTIDKFLARLTPERSFWRLAGACSTVSTCISRSTVRPRPGLHDRSPTTSWSASSERRAPRPATGGVLFTIRTHITKAADLAADPKHAPVIAEALAAMPSPVRRYKQIDQVAEALGDLFGGTDSGARRILTQTDSSFRHVGRLGSWPSTPRSGR